MADAMHASMEVMRKNALQPPKLRMEPGKAGVICHSKRGKTQSLLFYLSFARFSGAIVRKHCFTC